MDDTGQQRFKVLCTFILIVASFPEKTLSSGTVEAGRAVTLQCPGFTPTPGGDQRAVFYWYKARVGDRSSDNRVAFFAKRGRVVNSEGDLDGRATIDRTTGALQITKTRVSDDHVYTCLFAFTSVGQIKNEIHLTITVTPSGKDLQVTANPSGPVLVGESVTFNCRAPRVRPPPRRMYWQFSDEPRHFGDYRHVTNIDGLTSSVSVQYSLTVSRRHHGRKLGCHYVSSSRSISSEKIAVQVLAQPIGKPSLKSNKLAVKVNSKVDLKCDSSQVNGSATWFVWKFANGTTLGNTTQPTWTYPAKEKEKTLQFVCIAGNWLGQSDTSELLMITVQNSGGQFIEVAIGTSVAIGGFMAGVAVAVSVYLCRKRRTGPSTQAEENPSVHYDEIDPAGSGQPPQDNNSEYMKPIGAPLATYKPLGEDKKPTYLEVF